MNSLNLLSSRVISQGAHTTQRGERRRSYSEGTLKREDSEPKIKRTSSHRLSRVGDAEKQAAAEEDEASDTPLEITPVYDEKTPLMIGLHETGHSKSRKTRRRLVRALSSAIKWLIHSLTAPVLHVIRAFYDTNGRFSLFMPVKRISGMWSQEKAKSGKRATAGASPSSRASSAEGPRTSESMAKSSFHRAPADRGFKSRSPHSNLTTSSSSDESTRLRRSIRMKSSDVDTSRKRKQKRPRNSAESADVISPPLTVDNIKSPIAPTSNSKAVEAALSLRPPRPLIPRRQPSYSATDLRSSKKEQKTLVIDLDETLIHSLAKGGRMSSGHMVEVKLNTTVGFNGGAIGPQHPILYYVHKRPHCDEFLRKVCKWYNLVVFTASVQEYADPVIDWLEQERNYFSRRLYRQHCTFRNGAYIKDLSSVEPDLRKIMILDNSPLSYIFHEDNAIPIEGWISDPTDNDLLHLVPILEALQHVTDVRALLSLRRGEMVL